MKTLLSLLVTLAAAHAQQVAYPLAATAPLVYAANYGYATYGLDTANPPNNPFEFRTALDVFRPNTLPVYSAPQPYFGLGFNTYYRPSNSFALPTAGYFGGFRHAFAAPAPAPAPLAVAAPAAVASPAAVTTTVAQPAAVAAAIPAAPTEVVAVPEVKDDDVTVVIPDANPAPVEGIDLSLRAIFPVFESGLRASNGPIRFLRPDQFQRAHPTLAATADGADGGVIAPDLEFTPTFYNAGFFPFAPASTATFAAPAAPLIKKE